MKMINLNWFAKLGIFLYINIYLIFPKLAIPQNTKIDELKDESKINDYFSAFLLATERTKSLSQRYTKTETWEGLEKEFMLRTNKMDGKFHYKELLDFYKELEQLLSV